MKKLFLITALGLTTLNVTYAQSSKVMAAYNYLDDYNNNKDGEDLVTAKEAIDAASTHESTSVLGKTWYYKGLVYYTLSKDSLLNLTDDSFKKTAFESFEKALSLEDKKFRDADKAVNYLKAISADVFNLGVEQYSAGEFEGAYKSFSMMKQINASLLKNGATLQVSEAQVANSTAASAEQAGLNKEAILAYKELLELDNNANNYRFLASLYKRDGDKEKAFATLEEAAKVHPQNADIIIDQLNYFIEDGKLDQAIDKIDKAIELQPENDMLYFIKGNAYDKSGDIDNAIIEYEKAIEINPKNDKALYNAGAMYFLGANKYITEMNDLSYNETAKYDELNKKRKDLYLIAKPYFEKVLELLPEDDASKKALFKINSALED